MEYYQPRKKLQCRGARTLALLHEQYTGVTKKQHIASKPGLGKENQMGGHNYLPLTDLNQY